MYYIEHVELTQIEKNNTLEFKYIAQKKKMVHTFNCLL